MNTSRAPTRIATFLAAVISGAPPQPAWTRTIRSFRRKPVTPALRNSPLSRASAASGSWRQPSSTGRTSSPAPDAVARGASSPTARTLPRRVGNRGFPPPLKRTADASSETRPCPRTKTRVRAVPRSTAMSSPRNRSFQVSFMGWGSFGVSLRAGGGVRQGMKYITPGRGAAGIHGA